MNPISLLLLPYREDLGHKIMNVLNTVQIKCSTCSQIMYSLPIMITEEPICIIDSSWPSCDFINDLAQI